MQEWKIAMNGQTISGEFTLKFQFENTRDAKTNENIRE